MIALPAGLSLEDMKLKTHEWVGKTHALKLTRAGWCLARIGERYVLAMQILAEAKGMDIVYAPARDEVPEGLVPQSC